MVVAMESPRIITLRSLLLETSVEPFVVCGKDIFKQLEEEETHKQIVAPIISYILGKLVSKNEESKGNNCTSAFDVKTPPDITISHYLKRIVKYTPCTKECYFVALVFLDRIIENNRFVVNSLNVHRILITSIMIAAKLLDDDHFGNLYFSKVGGLEVKELNALEVKFLELLHYNLSVSDDVVLSYRNFIERQCLLEVNNSEFESDSNAQPSSSEEDEEFCQEPSDFAPHSLPASGPRAVIGREKKLRRSKSFSSEGTIFVKTHRRKRSSSFHAEIMSVVALA